MEKAGLITWREHGPWADSIIRDWPSPPRWILDLSLTKFRGHVLEKIQAFVVSEPIEPLKLDTWCDEYVASQYLRYERREISWATFLLESGKEADANGGHWACENFYSMLNAIEEADFDVQVEAEQRQFVLNEYADMIASVRRTYEALRNYRRQADKN